jgi:hypothetical protein
MHPWLQISARYKGCENRFFANGISKSEVSSAEEEKKGKKNAREVNIPPSHCAVKASRAIREANLFPFYLEA